MSSGGESVSTCGFAARFRNGRQACVVRKVPRVLTPSIRSKIRAGVSGVRVRLIALALLITMSMPPKCAAPVSTALAICRSSRTSSTMGSARPPAASICAAAVWIVPGSLG